MDLTLTPGAGGSDVVRAVLSKIDASGIFTSDNRFLRRIAFAQTRDGLRNDTYSDPAYHGGIWGVEEVQFNRTLDPTTYTQLNANDTIARIEAIFGVDWLNDVAWEDLRKPFFSGLAARLFLATIPEEIPLSSEFLAQASYYRRNYDPSTPEFEFLDDVTELVFSENEGKAGHNIPGGKALNIFTSNILINCWDGIAKSVFKLHYQQGKISSIHPVTALLLPD